MKIAINGVVYNSEHTPMVIEFNEEEQKILGGHERVGFSPIDATEGERMMLIRTNFDKLADGDTAECKHESFIKNREANRFTSDGNSNIWRKK